ncbi:MAG: VWA domain-containing protein [Candidatus Eisenbacteria bacterium]|nr:VWA domain-containing protein [Candidatus Eisenbacteria bacterium]
MRAFRPGFLAVLVFFLVAASVAAEEFPEVFFILDASGSMWGEAGEGTKIEAAREVLGRLVPELPAEVRVGFAAYGHREKKDCGDVEILMPPGSDDRTGLVTAVQAIHPLGMTPIAGSLRIVASSIEGRAAETTIVLVSDGKETCDADPCAVAADLKKAGARFVLHVVGFDVTDEEKGQLLCIAEAGGGRYFAAGDAEELLAALREVGEEVAGKVEEVKSTRVKASTGLGKLRLLLPEASAISLGGIRILKSADGAKVKEAEVGPESLHPLLAGDYRLVLLFGNPNYKPPTEVEIDPFTVAGGGTTEVVLGSIGFRVDEELPDLNLDGILLRRSGEEDLLLDLNVDGNDYYLWKAKPIPAGRYDVLLRYYRSPEPMVLFEGVEVRAGEETPLVVNTGFVLTPPASGGVTGWDLVPAGGSEPIIQVRRGWDNQEPLWRRFVVPPGTYDLMLHLDGMEEPLPAGQGIRIEAGETMEFDSGL